MIVAFFLWGLAGCSPRHLSKQADMLAIGDSILEANVGRGGSIPEIAARRTGHRVRNVAVSGAWATPGGGVQTIPEQRIAGKWAWIFMNGGANDLNGRCRCTDCASVMDELITRDAQRGVLVNIVEEALATGARVVFLGYPEMPKGAKYGFDRCGDELAEHRKRVSRLADRLPGMWFVDASRIAGRDDLPLFIEDRVHPSIEGSRMMGEAAAKAILQAEGRR